MNLIIKDAIRNVEFLKASFEILLDYIRRNIIKRYCETRWNSVYDRFADLAKHLRALNDAASADILARIDNAIALYSLCLLSLLCSTLHKRMYVTGPLCTRSFARQWIRLLSAVVTA